MEKKCKKCNVVKDVSEFYKRKVSKDGFRNECKLCRKKYNEENKESLAKSNKAYKEANKEKAVKLRKIYKETNKGKIAKQRREYRKENLEKIAKDIKKWKELNKDEVIQYNKEYKETNKGKIAKQSKKYKEENRDKINEWTSKYIKAKRKTDSLWRLRIGVRSAVRRYLKDGKSKTTREIIGIDFKEFKDYLEVEYTEGMHLDHIVPLSWANNDEEVYILNHYSNFQIITAEENLDKKDFYCKLENLKKVLDNHNDLTKLNKIIERNSDKIK